MENGRRRSGSRQAVNRALRVLERVHDRSAAVLVQTDQKSSYARLIDQIFAGRAFHERHDSKLRRDRYNPLFAINHTLAQMRDSISRLVRRSWAASKLAERLELHTWIWIAWRNYLRSITNFAPNITPAMVLGVESRQWKKNELLAWRILPASA